MKTRTISLFTALVLGCTSGPTTPPGTELLVRSFSADEGGPPATATDAREETHSERRAIGEWGAAVTVELTTARTDRGRYLRRVRVVTVEGAGGQLTAALGGTVTNGGTTAAPIAEQGLEFHWVKASACRTRSETTTVHVRGDGTIA
jgi:hypothetical protein